MTRLNFSKRHSPRRALRWCRSRRPAASFASAPRACCAAPAPRRLERATRVLRNRLNFLLLALRGRKMGFDKVVVMIDDMVKILKKEGQDDLDKKEYCEAQFDDTEDKKKA